MVLWFFRSAAHKSGLRIKVLGNRRMVPDDIMEVILRGEESTKHNDTMILNVCFPYTSRDDITNTIRSIAEKVEKQELDPNAIGLELFENGLYTS